MNSFKNVNSNILVIGDLMIDHYLWGSCERISPEAPVQVVDVQKETTVLGGAGNVINNLNALGAKVSVSSVIGNDVIGEELQSMLKSIGVNCDNIITQKGRKNLEKSRVIASSQQVIRYDKESKNNIEDASVSKILDNLIDDIKNYDVIILSDYGKGVLRTALCQGVIDMAKNHNIKVLVDPKGSDFSKYKGAYLLTPNKKEAVLATGIEINDEKTLEEALLKLKMECDLGISLITLSEDGIATHDGKVKKFPTVAKEVFDVTGAGDTVIASIAFALSLNKNIEETARFANLAAGVVVGKIGSATVTIDEIEEYEASLHQSTSDAHIKSFEEIQRIVTRCSGNGKKIVFTNGCFDILHVGHVKYLQVAKVLGDILVVGLNSDESVSRLKGPSRPVNMAEDRAYILAALEAVDFVVPFTEDTPHDLIKMIRPDVLVKGGDYEGKAVVGTEFASELKLVDFVDGKSTTKTIQKYRDHNAKKLILLAASFASAFALNSVEINVNNKDLEGAISIDMSQLNDTVEPDTVFIGAKILNADKDNSDYTTSSEIDEYYEVSFLMKRNYSHELEIGLGMKLNGTKNFTSIPLGGEVRYALDTELPIYLGGAIYFAPSVLAMRDAKGFTEYRITLDIEVIENAMVTMGYRSLDTDYEKGIARDINYNSSFYAGFKFKF